MIVNGLLFILQTVVNILLSPLTVVSIGIDFAFSFPIVKSFLSVVFYILPLNKITPLIVLIIALFTFRTAIAAIKTIWNIIGRGQKGIFMIEHITRILLVFCYVYIIFKICKFCDTFVTAFFKKLKENTKNVKDEE